MVREMDRRWNAVFSGSSLVRRLGVIEYVACRATADGSPRLVAAAVDGSRDAASLLDEIARVHRLLDHPRVARVAEVDDDGMFVAFACDAVTDLEAITAAAVEVRHPFSLPGVTAFTIDCLEMLEAAHAVIDPKTKQPVRFGPFASANTLVSETGYHWFFGWGQPSHGVARSALLDEMSRSYTAPETMLGAPVTEGSDLAAAVAWFHSFVHLGEMPPAVVESLSGRAPPGPLADLVGDLIQNAHAPLPVDRSIRRFLSSYRRVLALLGISPDVRPLERDLAALRRSLERTRSTSRLTLARDGRWIVLPDDRVERLERRGATRRILVALAKARCDMPGAPLSWEQLVSSGWPSEHPQVDAAKNRVYVAIAALRSMGLRNVLLRQDQGYLFDPAISIVWSDGDAPPGS